MEAGNLSFSETGSPQGGVISPLLANIYLHYVLDDWFEQQVKPMMRNTCRLIRYADDFVIIFAWEYDAKRVLKVLPKRFGKYGLAVHPEKTKLVDFRNARNFELQMQANAGQKVQAKGRPETFDLLGFTHYWGRSINGHPAVRRKTMKSRLARSIQAIEQWCRENRHLPVREQWEKLCEKVRGHYAYYGITGNNRSLSNFRHEVERCWRKHLERRNRNKDMTWNRFRQILKQHPLPFPKIVHKGKLNEERGT